MVKSLVVTSLLTFGFLTGCANTTKAPAVSSEIRKSLDQSGLKDVSVSQDRDKGVVTLGGHVATNDDKGRADQIARSMAAGQVVANQVEVVPPNDSSAAKTVDSDLDKGIDKNLDATLVANGLDHGVSHSVKNGVVTLKGTVDTDAQRNQLAALAERVPNTQQVVNEIQTRHTKATTSNN